MKTGDLYRNPGRGGMGRYKMFISDPAFDSVRTKRKEEAV
jgi:hypothetical protein